MAELTSWVIDSDKVVTFMGLCPFFPVIAFSTLFRLVTMLFPHLSKIAVLCAAFNITLCNIAVPLY